MTVLNAFYDLEVGPVSFDFIVFLVKAELERRLRRLDRLHVVVVPFAAGMGGMFRDKSKFYDQHEAQWRLWNIVIPGCQLVGASVTLAVDWEQATALKETSPYYWPVDWDRQTLRNRPHLVGSLIDAASADTPIPLLRASEHARRAVRGLVGDAALVTMTMRTTYLEERNTSLDDWWRAAQYIRSLGYVVMPIQDVSMALITGVGYGEFSLDLRMAMYQEARMNLQANNGAASLCWFSDKPYRMFDAGVGETGAEWRGLFCDQGLPWGATWPWAKPQQKIVYQRSTAEVIIREFDEWAGATK